MKRMFILVVAVLIFSCDSSMTNDTVNDEKVSNLSSPDQLRDGDIGVGNGGGGLGLLKHKVTIYYKVVYKPWNPRDRKEKYYVRSVTNSGKSCKQAYDRAYYMLEPWERGYIISHSCTH